MPVDLRDLQSDYQYCVRRVNRKLREAGSLSLPVPVENLILSFQQDWPSRILGFSAMVGIRDVPVLGFCCALDSSRGEEKEQVNR